MGVLSWLQGKHKRENPVKTKLVAGAKGGEVTPVVDAPTKPEYKRLLNRLGIIDKQIKKLKERGENTKIAHWEKRKDKTKALLWIYYDEHYKEDE